MKLLKVGDLTEVDKSYCHHQDVEDLKRLEPNVKFSREEALRNLQNIKASSSDVHHSHEEDPAHLAHCGSLDEALCDCEVHGGATLLKPNPKKLCKQSIFHQTFNLFIYLFIFV